LLRYGFISLSFIVAGGLRQQTKKSVQRAVPFVAFINMSECEKFSGRQMYAERVWKVKYNSRSLGMQSVESPVQLPLLLVQNMKVESGAACVQDVLQGTFDAQTTCGDGACAIHSVFGVLDESGQYFCRPACHFL
jgi:hypothetical protein